MRVIVTETGYRGLPYKAQSEDGRYEWFCGSEGYIRDNKVDRSIYRGGYMRLESFGADDIPSDVAADVKAFWQQLHAMQRTAEETASKAETDAAIAEARRPLTESEKAFRRDMAANDLIDAEDAWINSGRKGPRPKLGDTSDTINRRLNK